MSSSYNLSLRYYYSQVYLRRRSSDIGSPMVRIRWIFLVDVDFEEFVMSRTLEVLEPSSL